MSLTLFPNLRVNISMLSRHSELSDHSPIPMTVPYSGWASSACAGAVKERRARRANTKREMEERMWRDWRCVGRPAMVVVVNVCEKLGRTRAPYLFAPGSTCHIDVALVTCHQKISFHYAMLCPFRSPYKPLENSRKYSK